MINELDLQSGLGRRVLLDSELIAQPEELQKALDEIEQIYNAYDNIKNAELFDNIKIKLAQVRDIKSTIANLSQNATLDDIELFEIKHLCLTADSIINLLNEGKIEAVKLPDLNDAIAILDPDNTRIPHFYIYDAYSEELTGLRKKIKAAKEKDGQADELYLQSVEVEDSIRTGLSDKLRPYSNDLATLLNNLAKLDILIAKASQISSEKLVKPIITKDKTSYRGLFNPPIKKNLENEEKHYQPVDIDIKHSPCLITGANMSGKTVLLKTIQLAQYLFQLGFYIPASQASIYIVDEVIVSIVDEQEEMKGLSSYAAEMLTINDMINVVKSGKRTLLLIDELARATNPTEGKAIVSAMLDFLVEHKAGSIITTHYSGIQTNARRLRVKGFIEEKVSGSLNKSNINDYIDYNLIEDDKDDVPMDAIRVAQLLGVSNELLDKAKLYITRE
jgi:DNA mismatch repair ATPase MutS